MHFMHPNQGHVTTMYMYAVWLCLPVWMPCDGPLHMTTSCLCWHCSVQYWVGRLFVIYCPMCAFVRCIANGVDMLIFQIYEHADILFTFIVLFPVVIGAETVVQKCLTQCTYKQLRNHLLSLFCTLCGLWSCCIICPYVLVYMCFFCLCSVVLCTYLYIVHTCPWFLHILSLLLSWTDTMCSMHLFWLHIEMVYNPLP